MKTLFTILCSACMLNMQAQFAASAIIDANNISAKFFSNGYVSSDGNATHFAVPADSGIHALYAGSLWVAGFDNQFGMLHSSCPQNNFVSNFEPGPIGTNYDTVYLSRYNKVWKVTRAEIQTHQANYANGGYVAPADIASWPGNGNTANGEPAQLAPYLDVNSNGVYEPQQGEYPVIKGDKALYYIYSDRANPDNNLHGNPLKIDVHALVYGYENTNGADLNNTLFVHYNIVNRGGNSYRDMLIGSWNDFDLGCWDNDLIGSDSVLSTFFAYNQGADNGCSGIKGYSNSHVALGVTFLNHPMYSTTAHTNGAPSTSTDPGSPFMKYYRMNGQWNDGTPYSYGGTGYTTGQPTRYLFSGNPCDTSEWSDPTSGHSAGDRRAIGAIGKFNLPLNGNLCVDLAYVFATGNAQAACQYDAVDSLKQRVKNVQSFYNIHPPACSSLVSGIEDETSEKKMAEATVFPNPSADGGWQLTVGDNLIGGVVEVFDGNGRVVFASVIGHRSSVISPEVASGIYLLRISSSKQSVTRKLVRL
ncbi:MAG: T9SS type A sorting domain-containing protein [Bacteroidota bacterium]